MTDWNKLKVVDLKAELKRRGLAQTGLKPTLVARLAAAENGEESESEATIQEEGPKFDASSVTSPDTISPTQPWSDLSADLHADASQVNSNPRAGSADRDPAPADSMIDGPIDPIVPRSINASQSSQPSSQTDAHGSALPSVESQEAIEDRQKRKRRSQTPPLSATDAARKRFRVDNDGEESEELATTGNGSAGIGKHHVVNEAEVDAASREVAPAESRVEPPTVIDMAKEEVVVENISGETSSSHGVDPNNKPHQEGALLPSEFEDSPVRQRFKGLFSASQTAPAMEKSASRDSPHDFEDEHSRVVEPAIHPATAALYIRDFMRPLNTLQLKSHLAALATPPGHEIDPDLILNFYIDPIRTHAFVAFQNVSAAARVRSALHGSIWPEERNRKPLWVDFIPADNMDDWIYQEQSTAVGARSTGKKWEVVYHNIDEDRPIEATLEEASNLPIGRLQPTRQPSIPGPLRIQESHPPQQNDLALSDVPSGPRINPQRAPLIQEPKPTTSLSTLDQLFRSTTAKPVLYWLPVPKDLAHKRLDTIDVATSKSPSRGAEINRYTFEDSDKLVDRGPEIFPGIRPPPGFRGPARGGGRGGFQGRGRGGSYDSYRGDMGYRGGRDNRRDSRDDRRY
jgi:hypothetical protein